MHRGCLVLAACSAQDDGTPERTRTSDLRFRKLQAESKTPINTRVAGQSPSGVASSVVFDPSKEAQSPTTPAAHTPIADAKQDHATNPELAAIVAAWDTLPDALRAGIVAMVNAAQAQRKSK